MLRAVELGLPMFLGILGGTAEHWAQYGTAYRAAWDEIGRPAEAADIAVAVHRFVADGDRQAKATYLEHELRMFTTGAAEIGRAGPPPAGRGNNYEPGGMVFAGGPDEIADRILHLHQLLGHSRQILQMDIGGMPHDTFLTSIELLGTQVPQMRKELG
ncbi:MULTISPECIES: LLM class flavin-dependent oxidoreductase [unclassified Micromonospora]|uniref:LLM class flavin-dependent oxidoreductase n=1 Tax=unclassified Micromonospora TaxID=2617518 RepID=UPI003332C84B